jgi:hypothetical protein
MGDDVQYMEDRDLVNSTIEKVLKEQMEPEELKTVEKHHRSMSEAIGFPVGVTKMKELESLKPGSLYTSNLNLYYDVLDRLHSKSTDNFLESKNKENFLQFLKSKDDNLLLLTTGVIYSMITFGKINPLILHAASVYPIGFKRKNVLL